MHTFFNVIKFVATLTALFILATILALLIGEIDYIAIILLQSLGIGIWGGLFLGAGLSCVVLIVINEVNDCDFSFTRIVIMMGMSIVISLIILALHLGIGRLLDHLSNEYVVRLLVSGGLLWLVAISLLLFINTEEEIKAIFHWTPKPKTEPK